MAHMDAHISRVLFIPVSSRVHGMIDSPLGNPSFEPQNICFLAATTKTIPSGNKTSPICKVSLFLFFKVLWYN
jgi:hypothetical protein